MMAGSGSAALLLAARARHDRGQITTWWRLAGARRGPTLAAVGVLAGPAGRAAEHRAPASPKLGIPTALATWIGAADTPTAAQVFSALEEAQ
jgi:hypothetical protein